MFCGLAQAQCRLPAGQTTGRPADSKLLPEYGLLTNDTYSNLYFGFTLHLPIPLSGHRLMLPIRLAGEHALLAIGFQNGQRYGTFIIMAGDRREEDTSMTPGQLQQQENEPALGKSGAVAAGPGDFAPPPIHFKRVDRHSGALRGTQFSTRLRDYELHFTVQTNDKEFLQTARKDIEGVRVFCTDGAGNFFTPDGKSFRPEGEATEGPTIPTAVVDEAIRTRPAEHTIPLGRPAGNTFRIPELDFSYTLAAGWRYTQEQPPQDADANTNQLTERLYYLWRSCARTLLRGIAANGKAALELRVLDQACLAIPFPASATDSLGSESLGEFLEMLGRFGEIKSNRIVQSGGRVFTIFGGISRNAPAEHQLQRRRINTIVATRYNNLIFAWCWSAPEPDLQQIPPSEVTFGNTAAIMIGPEMNEKK